MVKGVVSVRGIEMSYDEEGSGAAFVLLHGFPLNRSMWLEQAEVLSANFRVIAPDLRGLGETPLGGVEAATMEEMAKDVAALLDALNVERAMLGALSMGGYVALEFFRRFPKRVRALVLADTRSQADDDNGKRTREENARKVLQEGVKPLVDSMLPKMLSASTRERRPDMVERVSTMMLAVRPEDAAAALRGMAVRRDQTETLSRIDVPTLVIVGTEDSITPPSDAESMTAKIEGARLVRVEGAAHLSNVERPEEFNRALVDFVSGL